MVALFAFIAGFVWDLPLHYFLIGFLCLILDGPSGRKK